MTASPQVLRTVQQVRQWRLQRLLNRETVGFVPTMGALHAGHCSLISASLAENDHTVVSIFVNPSQFAPHEDLDAYPRTLESDLDKINGNFGAGAKNVLAIFVPKVTEMYPSGINLDISKQRGAFVSVLGVSEQLEGGIRPQFFRGVATVVSKLLNVVTPENVYFGQKDAQQCVVIKNLVKDMLINTNVQVLPTLREKNGLAMSSRNAYLSDEVKDRSSIIYKGLSHGASVYKKAVEEQGAKEVDAKTILSDILSFYNADSSNNFTVEYLNVSHPETLEDLEAVVPGVGAIVSTAVRVPREGGGETRLIDNIVLK